MNNDLRKRLMNGKPDSVKVSCHNCDYLWNFGGDKKIQQLENTDKLIRVTCPNCLLKVNLRKHRVDK
jgi:RNase P subunit RPR2